ncbi:hypothetical protein SPIRO4BDMA_30040 [uncultured spirochete]|uniref:Uncharacterized protein n=1 Tax=uncultured spirochete TaxID=156406 RepID=A0A3P3XNB0_9SPIR|nr:hypothetical protein SPIRO4BDMA_30040 [uncultured spirochete]
MDNADTRLEFGNQFAILYGDRVPL